MFLFWILLECPLLYELVDGLVRLILKLLTIPDGLFNVKLARLALTRRSLVARPVAVHQEVVWPCPLVSFPTIARLKRHARPDRIESAAKYFPSGHFWNKKIFFRLSILKVATLNTFKVNFRIFKLSKYLCSYIIIASSEIVVASDIARSDQKIAEEERFYLVIGI